MLISIVSASIVLSVPVMAFSKGLKLILTFLPLQEAEVKKLFEWCDGPLVLAMKEGAMFLVDEISLADDSVLERLNSVLEPERTLLLAEKGASISASGHDVDVIIAKDTFRVIATMNPGGDFGKKEVFDK